MITEEITRSGREIMSGDRRQTVLPPLLRRQGPTVAVPVELEPQDRRSQDAAFAQVVASPWLHCAKVLPNDHGICPVGLQCQDADHGLVVVTNVCALCGMNTLGNPPQPKQADHMINTQAAGMAQ